MIAPGGSIKIRRGELRKSQTRVRGRPERHQSFFTSAARAQKRVRRASAACTLPASAVISTRVCRRCCLWISWRPNRSEFLPTELQQSARGGKAADFFWNFCSVGSLCLLNKPERCLAFGSQQSAFCPARSLPATKLQCY